MLSPSWLNALVKPLVDEELLMDSLLYMLGPACSAQNCF